MKTKVFIISIFFLFLQSCVLRNIKKTDDNFKFKTILSDKSKSYIYRANLNLFDNDFSGMIIIKPQSTNHRIVFINEIGMKFFDLEFSKDDYKVNQIFEPLNKKMFINLMVNDFRFILMSNISSQNKTYKSKKDDLYVIKPKNKKELYYFNNEDYLPKNAVKYSIFRKITFLKFEDYFNEIPHKILLKHKNIKFHMEMEFVK